MPGRVDEVKWNRAKAIVRGQKGGVNNKYALVNHIYQNMGGTFHSTKKSLGENNMGSQYEKIMGDHKLTHQDLVKSMLAEVAGESALEKSLESQAMRYGRGAINYGKTKAYRNKMLQRGEDYMLRNMPKHIKTFGGGGAEKSLKEYARLSEKYGPPQKHILRHIKESPTRLSAQAKRHVRRNAKIMGRSTGLGDVSHYFKLNNINDMCKGILGRGLMAATRGVRAAGSGIENLAGRASAMRTAQTGVARPKGMINRGVSAVGGALRNATPRQVGIGMGVAGAGAAGGYMMHRRNQNQRRQG